MPIPRLVAFALAAVLGLAVIADLRVVGATDIPRLEGPVTDRARVLGGRVAEVEAALDALLRERGIQLFVLFDDTTDGLTVTAFADETARVNSLGGNDVLLVVAVEDRTDAIWVSDALVAITNAELDEILARVLEPRLRSGDFVGAAVASAVALGNASTVVAPTAAQPQQAPPAPAAVPATDNGGVGIVAVLGILALVVGGLLVVRWLIVRRSLLREADERDRGLAAVAREANSLLIATDERIRAADDEAGFVEAEYGEAEAAPFRAALAEARAELSAAFAIRQRLDDGDPEDPPTREAMLGEIVERLRRAGTALDRQAARLKELRDLERNASAILEALPSRIATQEARLPAVDATLEGLRAYAESAWAAVQGNVAEARKGLAGARAGVERGLAAVGRGATQSAGQEIRTSQEGLAGATSLLDAVEKLAATLRDAEGLLVEELRAAETDLAAARAAAAGSGAAHGLAGKLTEAEDALTSAQAAAALRPLDPIVAHRLATTAHGAADQVLIGVRAEAERQARAAAALEAALATARAEVDRTADFIATRHNGVERQARTRLAEAERLLAEAFALRETQPEAATEQATRAESLAEEAYSLARSDFDRWDSGGPGVGRGGPDLAGAIIGGILGGMLSGGGRGGGWGGSPWGSPGSSGRGGWGGGRSRGGGFGGFGGGGRSRGGRW